MALFNAKELPSMDIEAKQHPWANSIKGLYSRRFKYAHNSIRNPMYPVKEEKQPDPDRVQFTVIGDRLTKAFSYCRNLVIGLHKYKWKNFDVPIIRGCSSIEWPDVWHDLKLRFPDNTAVNCQRSSVAVFVNGRILGGENELQQLVDSKYYYHLCLDYCNEGVAEFARFIRSSGRPIAYMHVSIDDTHVGTFIFMLYADIVPYTCENFLRLCKETKGGYGGTPVHRIVKDGWIQCGGFGLKRTPLSCENFIIPFDKRGVLAMTNDGRDDDCSTQFFVVLQPAPWMNHKYVAFGQLIEGADTLKKIERVTTWYESPTSKIILYRCGILNMDCHDIMINSGVNEYTDDHIENLNDFTKLLWEHIIETVWNKAQLKEKQRLREQDGDGAMGKTEKSIRKKFKKAADDFALQETEYEVREEEDTDKDSAITSDSLVLEPQRPFYIPLTDVPYPGDVESDFDLKRFLKGDYCLECDLDINAYENARIKGNPSLLFDWSDSDLTFSPSDEISLNSEEQKELNEYLKDNVDRVSFAGSIVKNIAKKEKKTDIFSTEKQRASELITDEKLRKLKLATADLMYRERRNTKVSIAVPGAYSPEIHKEIKRRQTGFVSPEDLEKIRVFSRQHFSDDEDDDDDKWSKKHVVHMDPGIADSSDSPRRLRRRPTGFISAADFPHDDDDDEDEDDEDDEDDDDVIPTPFDNTQKDDDDDVKQEIHFAPPDDPENDHTKGFLKRRLTAFVRPGAIPVDNSDDGDDNDDDEEEPAPSDVHKSHFAIQESPEETAPSEALMHRRPTAFVRPGPLPIDNDDEEEPAPSDVHKSHFAIQESPQETAPSEALMHRRPTAFVRPGPLPIDNDDKEEPAPSDVHKSHFAIQESPQETAPSEALMHRRPTAFVRPGPLPIDNDDEEEPAPSDVNKSHFAIQESPLETAPSEALMHRRPTAFVRPGPLPIDNDDEEPFPQKMGSKSVEERTTKHFTSQTSDDDKDPAMKPSITVQKPGLKFAGEDNKHTHPMKRRATAFVRASDIQELDVVTEHEERGSVLTRLYNEVDNDEPGPTLKNYKPTVELQNKKNTKLLLTHTAVLPATSEESRLGSRVGNQRHSRTLDYSFQQFANIQQGSKLDNKLSSDSGKTIDKLENRFSQSIRSMEYAKKRPTISVSQYQLMNRQYQEALEKKATPL